MVTVVYCTVCNQQTEHVMSTSNLFTIQQRNHTNKTIYICYNFSTLYLVVLAQALNTLIALRNLKLSKNEFVNE